MSKRHRDEKKKSSYALNNSLVFEGLINQAKKIIQGDTLDLSLAHFQEGKESYYKAKQQFAKVVKETPLLAAFLDWIQSKEPYDVDVENGRVLMESGMLPFVSDKDDILTISDLKIFNVHHQIDLIRCQRSYSVSDREEFVRTFLSFFKWLANQTDSFIPQLEDFDEERARGRILSFDDFIRLLELLDERCQLIAKLLYLGGKRTLEEVITLKISDLDFKNAEIDFEGERISYPLHVFEDIRSLIGKRTSGAIFQGRNNTSINPSTIFRNFKIISSSLGFQDFSPKSLTENR